jgi:hypothetical protein
MTASYLRVLAFLVSVSYAPEFLMPCLLRYDPYLSPCELSHFAFGFLSAELVLGTVGNHIFSNLVHFHLL